MNAIQASLRLSLVAAVVALLCAPAILLAERLAWPQAPLHVVQLSAVVLCFLASLVFLWCTRGTRSGGPRWVALTAAALSGVWLLFIGFVLVTFSVG